jgi:hypothetical protein
MFRAISVAIGLALLVVTGTAALIAAFSGPVFSPRAYGAHDQPVLSAPGPDAAQALSLAGDDQVLYQRVARADSAWAWELIPTAQTTPAQDLNRVSYSLQARPGGFSKTLKSCSNPMTGHAAKPKTLAAYDISCTTLG